MYMAPGFVSLVLIYNYAKAYNNGLKRKNPKDYENEEWITYNRTYDSVWILQG